MLADKVNTGEALTWDDVNGAQCVYLIHQLHLQVMFTQTMWLMDNFGMKITDFEKSPLLGGYGDIAANLATEQCDVGVGYADIRRDYDENWLVNGNVQKISGMKLMLSV